MQASWTSADADQPAQLGLNNGPRYSQDNRGRQDTILNFNIVVENNRDYFLEEECLERKN